MENRIRHYFDPMSEQAEIYAECCDAAWEGMTNGDFDVGFGVHVKQGIEDFYFRITDQGRENLNKRRN